MKGGRGGGSARKKKSLKTEFQDWRTVFQILLVERAGAGSLESGPSHESIVNVNPDGTLRVLVGKRMLVAHGAKLAREGNHASAVSG